MLASKRWLVVPLLFATACAADTEDGGDPAGTNTTPAAEADLHEVPCTDQSVSQLMLFEDPSPAEISNQSSDGVFESLIDATAGGMQAKQSFVYARFTPTGLTKVAVGDEDAFNSGEWHIALRRYIIRLNSGVSGPSAVLGARTRPDTTFDDLSVPPPSSEIPYREEQYYSETCDFMPDGSGIGGPQTALSSFWKYQECVQMTGNVFVVALPDGGHVKLQVLAYYTTDNQRVCDETGKVPLPSGAGNVRIRWAFLE